MSVRFGDIVKKFNPLKWVQNTLVFNSTMGEKELMNLLFCSDEVALCEEYDKMELMMQKNTINFSHKFEHSLSLFRNISGTLSNIDSSVTLSELELFEVKYFAYHIAELKKILTTFDVEVYEIPDLTHIFELLDKNGSGVVSFYLYDNYDDELRQIRGAIKSLSVSNSDSNELEELYLKLEKVSCRVRENLTRELKSFITELKKAFNLIGKYDLLYAKVRFKNEHGGVRPNFVDYGQTAYSELINQHLRHIVEERKERYQAVDLELKSAPILITGANMSGKTMVLKSVALAQYLVQYGFYAPAKMADIALVDDIILIIGDSQNEERGLSSYGSEILAISDMVDRIYGDEKYLVLIDEPARTTSPKEGSEIVNVVVDLLAERAVMALITTHYDNLTCDAKRLRVKGFVDKLVDNKVSCKNINQFIDYSLIESDNNEMSSEAVVVAQLLGVTDKLIDRLKK